MPGEPLIISPSSDGSGTAIKGSELVIGDWPVSGTTTRDVAPLHVHHKDDEAWHVISGALRFRLEDREVTVGAGSSVLVPAGVPHTFGNAGPGPSRYIIVMPKRLDALISRLHETDPAERPAVYEEYTSQVLE